MKCAGFQQYKFISTNYLNPIQLKKKVYAVWIFLS